MDPHESNESIADIRAADPLHRVLCFIRDHDGIVLSDWAAKPQTLKECRVVFPTKLRKAIFDGGASEFTKAAINHFYPGIEASMTGNHRVTVWVGTERRVQLLESDLERRRITIPGANKLEYPTYPKAFRSATRWPFLGVDGILVQMS
jgi:hypothetical protein